MELPWKLVTLLARLRKYIEEARSMQKLAQTLVAQAKEDTKNNVQPSKT